MASSKSCMFHQNIVQPAYLCQTRHKDQDSSRIRHVGWVIKAYSLENAQNEIVWYQTLIEEIDSSGSFRRIFLLEFDILLHSVVVIIISCWRFFSPVRSNFVLIEFIMY